MLISYSGCKLLSPIKMTYKILIMKFTSLYFKEILFLTVSKYFNQKHIYNKNNDVP